MITSNKFAGNCEMMGMKGRCARATDLQHEGIYFCGSCFHHVIMVQAVRAEKQRVEALGEVVA